MQPFSIITISIVSLFLLPSCCTTCCSEKTCAEKQCPCSKTKPDTKKNEITTTKSGLQYKIISEGTEDKTPRTNTNVTVHYTGWLQNADGSLGKKFDSSVDRGTPFTFIIGKGRVIQGWDEGVMEMKVGEKRRLIIPPRLGYGSRGAGNVIPPHSTLIFDVELIKID